MFTCILGPGGTGKTWWLNNKIKEDPQFALRTSTTGISAINLGGGVTINSALGYFDTKSLLKNYLNGSIYKQLIKIASVYKNIAIDEVSMLEASQLDIICMSLDYLKDKLNTDLGLVLLGDMGQLPNVSGEPIFKSKNWHRFEVTYMTEVKRQTDKEFIDNLHTLRKGKGSETANWFKDNIEFSKDVDEEYKGSTFFSTNRDVDNFNSFKLSNLPSKITQRYITTSEGKLDSSWKNIPAWLDLKVGALVMILINNKDRLYANGDLAIVEELYRNGVLVRLLRNNDTIVVQNNLLKKTENNKQIGYISYMPLRVAYATTIHKAQSLTLDSIQIKLGDSNLSRLSGGLYTAISRVKNKEGLRLVGREEEFIKSCFINKEYIPYVK